MCTRFGFENKFFVSHKICGHAELKIQQLYFECAAGCLVQK